MRKTICVFILTVLLIGNISLGAEELNEESLSRLSHLLKKGGTAGVQLPSNEKKEIERLLVCILPDKDYIGENKEWAISYHDMEEGDFFQVDLKNKGDESFNKDMWFHILYIQEKPSFYGNEDFEGYRGMGMKDVHYFILVGNVEIRAVASSQEYKNDNKIKEMLKAFKLKKIENLP